MGAGVGRVGGWVGQLTHQGRCSERWVGACVGLGVGDGMCVGEGEGLRISKVLGFSVFSLNVFILMFRIPFPMCYYPI